MTTHDSELERHRRALLTATDRDAAECSQTDAVWQAVSGELSPTETAAIVDHVAECPICARAWRMARELAPPELTADQAPVSQPSDAGTAGHTTPPPRTWKSAPATATLARPQTWIGLAAAASLAVALGVLVWSPESPIGVRSGDDREIQSLLDEGEPLPREDFLLRWSDGPEGSRYRLSVTTEDLQPVLAVDDLEEAAYLVDVEQLTDLPEGTRLLWRIETTWPDGQATSSQTFVAVLD